MIPYRFMIFHGILQLKHGEVLREKKLSLFSNHQSEMTGGIFIPIFRKCATSHGKEEADMGSQEFLDNMK